MAQAIGQGSRVAQGEDPSLIKLRNRSEKEKAVDENVIQGNGAKKRKFEEAGTVIPERMIQRVEEGNETGYGDSTMCISSRGGRDEESSSGGQIRAGHGVVAAGHVGGFQDAFYQQTVSTHFSSLETAMASTGLLLGNIAKGLVEGASPMITNIIAMHKVKQNQLKLFFNNFYLRIPSLSRRLTMGWLSNLWWMMK